MALLEYNVGVGQDYSDWFAAINALPSTLNDDYTFTQKTALAQTSVLQSNSYGKSVNLNGHTVKFVTDSPHAGVFGDAHLNSFNPSSAGAMIGFYASGGSGLIEVENLAVRATGGSVANGTVSFELAASCTATVKVHDMIFDGNSQSHNFVQLVSNNASAAVYAWNIVGVDGGDNAVRIIRNNGTAGLENIWVSGCGYFGINCSSTAVDVRNCISTGNSGADFANISAATGTNNLSGDATAANGNWASGSGNTANDSGITDYFVSTSISSRYFLRVIEGTAPANGGTATAIADNTAGIRGNTRPRSGPLYSIGPDEFATLGAQTLSVGSGGDYSTWAAAIDDVPDTLPESWTLTQVSDTSEVVGMAVQKSIDVNGKTFTIDSGTPHQGNPTAGWQITGSGNRLIYLEFTGSSGTAEVKNLRCVDGGSGFIPVEITENSTGVSVLSHDLMIDGATVSSAGFIGTESGSGTHKVWNVTSYNGASDGSGLRVPSGTVENCVGHGGWDVGIDGDTGTATFINCVGFGNTTDFNNISNATGKNNASEDSSAGNGNWSTGSGNVTGITPANEFEALTWSSSDYLKVKSTGSLTDTGAKVTITSNIVGIRGDARPGLDRKYSVGADELAGSAPAGKRIGKQGKGVQIDTTNFSQNLNALDYTVQALANRVDEMPILNDFPEDAIADVSVSGSAEDSVARTAVNQILAVLREQGLINS